jgi:hypothetical protein
MRTNAETDWATQRPRAVHRPPSRRALAVLPGLLLAAVITAPAVAHVDLVTSSPKDKAVLETPPTNVTLTFSEGLDAGKSSFRLISAGTRVGIGRAAEDGAKTMTLVGLALTPGAYEIKWTSAATDGHIARGTLTFTVAQPTSAPATPTPVPATPEPTAEPSATRTSTPSTAHTAPTSSPAIAPTEGPATAEAATPAPDDGAGPATASTADALIPIVAGLVVVVGIGALVLRRSRRA